MTLKEQGFRRSDVAYVLARLRAQGRDYLLLHAHRKWGDWSLVGGHVEAWEAHDWREAAAREVQEEMAPLRSGADFSVEPLDVDPSEWGPVPSRSAGGALTKYKVRWFVLRFKSDPCALLGKLPSSEFKLVPIEQASALSSIAKRAVDVLPAGWHSLPLAWDGDLDNVPLSGKDAPVFCD